MSFRISVTGTVVVVFFNLMSHRHLRIGSVVLNFVEEIGVLQKCDCVSLASEGCFHVRATWSDLLEFSPFVREMFGCCMVCSKVILVLVWFVLVHFFPFHFLVPLATGL